MTWQTEGAVSALDLGATGDGVTDDWEALQHALDTHAVVFLPKGFCKSVSPKHSFVVAASRPCR